jgi:hypothetical protein
MPWGSSSLGSPGGTIPVEGEFDIFCVGSCGPMSYFITYDEVEQDGDGLQYATEPVTLDLLIGSGGGLPSNDARLTVNTTVPQSFTLDTTIRFAELPNDFSDIVILRRALLLEDRRPLYRFRPSHGRCPDRSEPGSRYAAAAS